jgi:signal transduction histidine kinase
MLALELRRIPVASAGPLMIAVIAIFVAVFQLRLFIFRTKFTWNLWGALVSLATAAYSAATFLQYNAISALLQKTTTQIQLSMLAVLILCIQEYSIAYLALRTQWSLAVTGSLSALATALIWSTGLIVGPRIAEVDFLLLAEPYRQAAFGPLGAFFLLYLAIVGGALFLVWLRQRSKSKAPAALIGAFAFWLCLGLEDAVSNLPFFGIRPLLPLVEYGFLGFCMAVLMVTLRDYFALFELAESRQRGLEQAVRETQQANRTKSLFLANMSHELRTPLNHIIGFTELAAENSTGGLDPNRAEYLGHVLDSGRHLLAIVNDILDLSKVEAGRLEISPEEVDPRELLQSCLTEFRQACAQRSIILSTHFEMLPETIFADGRRIRQVLINLLSNAVKFTPAGGRIQVATRCIPMAAGEGLEVSVVDTGVGLAREDLERIFHPFEQVEQSPNRKYAGSGLGLSLSRQLLLLHGGLIWAESEGQGRGSSFRFLLPLSPPPGNR